MKILLTGNIFHEYHQDISDGLSELGHQVDCCFNNIHGPYHRLIDFHKRVGYGILPNKLNIHIFHQASVNRYNEQLQQLYATKKHDLVIVISGKTIADDTLQYFKCPKVLWMLDSIRTYPEVEQKLLLFDHLFLFEPTDVDYLHSKTPVIGSYPLLAGFNPTKFYPKHMKRIHDVSFVGSFYQNREQFLGGLARMGLQNPIIIGGFRKSKDVDLKRINTKSQVTFSEANSVFNQSRINLNIHHPQSKEGLNPRTFEIMASGGVQLMDRKKKAEELFREDIDVLFYNSFEEFKDKITYYLKHERKLEIIRQNAYENAIKCNTWKHRMEEMIAVLKANGIL